LIFPVKISTGDVFVNFGSALNVLTAEFLALNPTGQLFSQSYSVAGYTTVPTAEQP
jgi:hypothetical protein